MAARPKRGRPFGPARLISISGEQRTLGEWSQIYEVPQNTILNRVARGWSWERAVIKRCRRYRTRGGGDG